MSPRKRRISVVEDPVEYPFFITFREKERRNNNKRKRDSQEEESMVQIQNSPFLPTGAFKTHDTMDVSYTVEPGKIWPSMTRYNSFIRESQAASPKKRGSLTRLGSEWGQVLQ
jgi:hypothetical protein